MTINQVAFTDSSIKVAPYKGADVPSLEIGASKAPDLSRELQVLVDALLSLTDGDDPASFEMIQMAVAASGIEQKLKSMRGNDALKAAVEIDKIKAFAKAAAALAKAEALKNNPFLKAFKWLAVIITAIIAALLLVASGGMLATVSATMMMGICALTIMAEVSNEVALSKGEEKGAIPSFDAICGMLCGVLAKAAGASDEEVEKAKSYGGLALSLFIQVGLGVTASASSAINASAQVTAGVAKASASGFSSPARSAMKVAGELFQKINIPAFQRVGKDLAKFADEASDAEVIARTLRISFTYLTYASLVSQLGDSVGTVVKGVNEKEVGDTAAEVVLQESMLRWLMNQIEISEEEAKELMQQLERSGNSINSMVAQKSKLISEVFS